MCAHRRRAPQVPRRPWARRCAGSAWRAAPQGRISPGAFCRPRPQSPRGRRRRGRAGSAGTRHAAPRPARARKRWRTGTRRGAWPPFAMPAAMVTAYSSQMPTSKKRCGNVLAKPESPTPSAIAAVTQTRRSSRAPSAQRSSPSAAEKVFSAGVKFLPGAVVEGGRRLRRGVPLALLRDGVQQHGLFQLSDVREHVDELVQVVPVDGADVLEAAAVRKSRFC